MENSFLQALQALESMQPDDALTQTFQFFRKIADLGAEDCVAAYQALELFESSMDTNLQQGQKQQMRKVREAVVVRMQALWFAAEMEKKLKIATTFLSVLKGEDQVLLRNVLAGWFKMLES